jgi:hypothetical protein
VVAFDKSPFKLITLNFLTKSVQAPSCMRPKTTLFLSFEINNCFHSVGVHETCMPRGEFKHRYWFFADTPNVAWFVSII